MPRLWPLLLHCRTPWLNSGLRWHGSLHDFAFTLHPLCAREIRTALCFRLNRRLRSPVSLLPWLLTLLLDRRPSLLRRVLASGWSPCVFTFAWRWPCALDLRAALRFRP